MRFLLSKKSRFERPLCLREFQVVPRPLCEGVRFLVTGRRSKNLQSDRSKKTKYCNMIGRSTYLYNGDVGLILDGRVQVIVIM
jgi:hypothetical protein